MNPRRYRLSRKQTLAEVAKAIGAANASTVNKHEQGIRFPSPDYIEAYRQWSGGKVQYEDFEELRTARRKALAPPPTTPATRKDTHG